MPDEILKGLWMESGLYMFIYICLSALEDHHAVYTRIGRIHSLATSSSPTCKGGVVPIFKMADLEQTCPCEIKFKDFERSS